MKLHRCGLCGWGAEFTDEAGAARIACANPKCSLTFRGGTRAAVALNWNAIGRGLRIVIAEETGRATLAREKRLTKQATAVR